MTENVDTSSSFAGSAADRKEIIIGSRQSSLAMIQTNYVIQQLLRIYPDHGFKIVTMETIGDKNLDKALPDIGDKGLFTQELETALLTNKVDFIVHSLKDLPTSLPPNCSIGAILLREDPSDVLVLRKRLVIDDPFTLITGAVCDLTSCDNAVSGQQATNGSTTSNSANGCSISSKNGTMHEEVNVQQQSQAQARPSPIIGSSSMRRQSQVKRFNRSIDVANVRGNINTRLQKLDGVWTPPPGRHVQHYDALILAASGLKRGGFEDRISYVLGQSDATNGSQDWYHAVGQGALAIECRQHDEFIHQFLAPLTHRKTIYETLAERSLLYHLEGGCSVPIGVRTEWSGSDDNDITLKGAIFSVDGETTISGMISGSLVTQLPADHNELKVKRKKLGDDENLVVGLPILPTSCPVLRSNYEICFNLGKNLAHELQERGGLEILQQIKEEKNERAKRASEQRKGLAGDSPASGSDDANSSFEPM